MSRSTARPPLIVASDLDGFFGLFIDNLVNLIIIAGTLTKLFGMPTEIVLGRVVPGCAVAILAGNIYYTWMARRLAAREGRSDVTALPYGISTPIMFAYLFLVIGPVYWATKDATLAWQVGVAASLLGGLVEILGALIGPQVQRITPRAALLGTLAGIAITWIAMKPTLGIWEQPLVGFLPLVVVLVGFVARVRMPFKLPAGLVAVVLGAAAAWGTGFAKAAEVSAAAANMGLRIPTPVLGDLLAGLKAALPYLMVVLPMGIYNFIETMNNIESAAVAGDVYPTREAMLVDGCGTVLGALFGSCFPTTVYIGHPGWKAVGARTGYTLLNGVAIFLIALSGLMGVVEAAIPKEVAFVILLYVALVIGAQAFQANKRKYAPAVVLAFLPHLAAWARSLIDAALRAAGSSAEAAAAGLKIQDVPYAGLAALGEGAIVTGLLLGAITVFLIDRRFYHAAAFAGVASVLAFFGCIHAAAIGIAAAPGLAAGYAAAAVVFVLLGVLKQVRPQAFAEPTETPVHGG